MISLETAIKLQEVAEAKGVTLPDGEFCYCDGNPSYIAETESLSVRINNTEFPAAYNTDELLEWLPIEIEDCYLTLERDCEDWVASYPATEIPMDFDAIALERSSSPSEALAHLLIYLIENDYIK